MTINKYPALTQFLGCYFHQDWAEEFDSSQVAIEAFVSTASFVTVLKTKKEIERILSMNLKEEDLVSILDDIGCYYNCVVDYKDTAMWLKTVFEYLDNHTPPEDPDCYPDLR